MANEEAKKRIEEILNRSGWTVDKDGKCTAK